MPDRKHWNGHEFEVTQPPGQQKRGFGERELQTTTDDIWVHESFTPGWLTAARLCKQDGALVISEIRVFPDEMAAREKFGCEPGEWAGSRLGIDASCPPGGVTTDETRSVSIPRMLELFARASIEHSLLADVTSEDERRDLLQKRGPRKKHGPSWYAERASEFDQGRAEGQSRKGTIEAMAGRLSVSYKTAEGYYSACRNAHGFLDERGRLTPRGDEQLVRNRKGRKKIPPRRT